MLVLGLAIYRLVGDGADSHTRSVIELKVLARALPDSARVGE
jgi:hypothetical protein